MITGIMGMAEIILVFVISIIMYHFTRRITMRSEEHTSEFQSR